ncbi:unnamed protein product [Heligmosomoides polygyrus]|uniref:Uncharacterized protein n=1 Tax=Heligmosomoides polygyrus TaxID=6339 RepID=A0A183FLU6_HELPZ|nr:unnamed protein product [Heligmosomoides polygyrus]
MNLRRRPPAAATPNADTIEQKVSDETATTTAATTHSGEYRRDQCWCDSIRRKNAPASAQTGSLDVKVVGHCTPLVCRYDPREPPQRGVDGVCFTERPPSSRSAMHFDRYFYRPRMNFNSATCG